MTGSLKLTVLALVSMGTLVLVGCNVPEPEYDAGRADSGTSGKGGGSNTGGGTAGTGGGSADAGSDAGVNADAIPISTFTPRQWTWVPFPNAKCRDGSTTGIGINVNPGSTKLLIFLKGGGACFNQLTCAGTPLNFGAADFNGFSGGGILNRSLATNPAKDWNMVYVSYCTGDVHIGSNPSGTVAGVAAKQAFVGYTNMTNYLKRLVPTFSSGLTQVVLTGTSAGGFGAMGNYDQVATAFAPAPVTLIDDSGPYMADPTAANCLQNQWRTLWALDQGALQSCGANCMGDDYLVQVASHLVLNYPMRTFSLISASGDSTISTFLGFGANNCGSFAKLGPEAFKQGLIDIRTRLFVYPNFGLFMYPGTEHTALGGDTSFQAVNTPVDGGVPVQLTDWVNNVFNGQVVNVGQ